MVEPFLCLDLPQEWRQAYVQTFERLAGQGVRVLLATYFEGLENRLEAIRALPVDGLHIDLVRAPSQLSSVLEVLRQDQILSVGLIDGRNIWRTDLDRARALIADAQARLGDRLWLAPSCSLLHVPVDLNSE